MQMQFDEAVFKHIDTIAKVSARLLAGEELHIWKLDLRNIPLDAASTLDKAELERYERIIPQQQKRRFLAGRSWLRALLSGYLGCAAHELTLASGDKGKPFLVSPDTRLEFNLSHTGDDAVLAVCADTPVGIDLERSREKLNLVRIARSVFNADELEQLENLSGDSRTDYFFTCWTQMEARQKCLGLGIFNKHRGAQQTETRTWRMQHDMLLSVAWANTSWQPDLRLFLPPGN